MQLAQDTTKSDREMTPLEQEHARLIGALMVCSRLLQVATLNESVDRPQDTIRELGYLLASLGGLYAGDGKRMEQEALALANLLGFHVEQRHIHTSSGGVH